MKKFFAIALAALTLVACGDKNKPQTETLKLNESEISVAVDATFQLTANLDVTWASSNEAIATVANGLVKGIAAGEANITATSQDGQKAICKVTVTGGQITPPTPSSPYAEFAQLNGSAYYVFFLQAGATEYLGNKVIYNFGPNDNAGQGSRWLYVWENTFTGGTGVGTDPFDQAEGWTALVQGSVGWAGMGLCVAINDANNTSGEGAAEDLAALDAIRNNITDYDAWYLAVALKNATPSAGYEFKLIGSNVDGTESGNGAITIAPAATGEWVYKEYKLSDIAGLEFGPFNKNGSNILTIVANPYMTGTQIDLGYAFLYKK
jgi:Bacterial surface proteins containing Ig-like domains